MAFPKRNTFILKCDKPRYDGGVEIDLKEYFGSRFQSDAASLKRIAQGQLNSHQRNSLGKDALSKEVLSIAGPHYDLDAAIEDGLADEWPETVHADEHRVEESVTTAWRTEAAHVPSSASAEMACSVPLAPQPVHTPFKAFLLEGPIQILVGLTGLSTGMLALCSLGLLSNPEGVALRAKDLVRSCKTLLIKGLWNTCTLPFILGHSGKISKHILKN
jgi:hypothetical protein